jgi:hypothetical protein
MDLLGFLELKRETWMQEKRKSKLNITVKWLQISKKEISQRLEGLKRAVWTMEKKKSKGEIKSNISKVE